MDILTPAQRSERMKRIRQKNTKPEIQLRRLLHAAGYRFRLHRKDLPGTPDIVLPGRRIAIFVHGCFWHGHDCKAGRLPTSNTSFWVSKIDANRTRDEKAFKGLVHAGWKPMVVWQCELRDLSRMRERISVIASAS